MGPSLSSVLGQKEKEIKSMTQRPSCAGLQGHVWGKEVNKCNQKKCFISVYGGETAWDGGMEGSKIWICPSPKRHDYYYSFLNATYSSLNGSQAQIAHHCLEPELSGEAGKEERKEGEKEGGES